MNVATKFIRGEIEGNCYGYRIENAESFVAQINALSHNITHANVVRIPRLTVIEGGRPELLEAAAS